MLRDITWAQGPYLRYMRQYRLGKKVLRYTKCSLLESDKGACRLDTLCLQALFKKMKF